MLNCKYYLKDSMKGADSTALGILQGKSLFQFLLISRVTLKWLKREWSHLKDSIFSSVLKMWKLNNPVSSTFFELPFVSEVPTYY